MNEEGQGKQPQPQRKSGRAMGGIERQKSPYATLGGSRQREVTQETEHLDAPPAERSETQASSHSDVAPAKRLEAQTPSHLDVPPAEHLTIQEGNMPDAQMLRQLNIQPSKHEDVQASKRPERKKRTVYLEPAVDRWIRHRIADTEQEISEVINEAVHLLMRSQSE